MNILDFPDPVGASRGSLSASPDSVDSNPDLLVYPPISAAEFASVARDPESLKLAMNGLSEFFSIAKISRLPVRLVIVSNPKVEQIIAQPASSPKRPTQVGVPLAFPQTLHEEAFLDRQEAMELAATFSYVYGTIVDAVHKRSHYRGISVVNSGFNAECWQPVFALPGNKTSVPFRAAATISLQACGMEEPIMLGASGHEARPAQLAALQNPAEAREARSFYDVVQASLRPPLIAD